MTNLDSIFKSKDITLPTKIHLVKVMVFPVVMYGCEIWTIKKAVCPWRIHVVMWKNQYNIVKCKNKQKKTHKNCKVK